MILICRVRGWQYVQTTPVFESKIYLNYVLIRWCETNTYLLTNNKYKYGSERNVEWFVFWAYRIQQEKGWQRGREENKLVSVRV